MSNLETQWPVRSRRESDQDEHVDILLGPWNKFWPKFFEYKAIITSRNSIFSTLTSSLWVWLFVNTVSNWNLNSIDDITIFISPFVAPLIIAPINQIISSIRLRKVIRVLNNINEDSPFSIMHLELEYWTIVNIRNDPNSSFNCPMQEWGIHFLLHSAILTNYYQGRNKFLITHEWRKYLFIFKKSTCDDQIIVLHWVDISEIT